MVIPGRAPMSATDRILADELAVQIKKLIYGRTVEDAVALLTAINEGMAAKRVEQCGRAASEPMRLH